MITIKFFRYYESGQSVEIGVSCQTYVLRRHNDGAATITVYKGFTHTDGVEYPVGGERPEAYDCAYIENSAGKTINHVRPPESPEPESPTAEAA